MMLLCLERHRGQRSRAPQLPVLGAQTETELPIDLSLRHGHNNKGIAGGDKKTGVVEQDNTFIVMERLGVSIDLPRNQRKRKKERRKRLQSVACLSERCPGAVMPDRTSSPTLKDGACNSMK